MLKRDDQYHRWLLPPAHLTDNLLYARESALGCAGITLLPRFLTDGDRGDARLVTVLPEWEMEGNELWLVYPSRKLNSPALMKYIEFALQSPVFREFYR